jgi:signal peptidase II
MRLRVTRSALLGISAGVFALDRWSKWLIETRLSPFDSKTIIPGFFSIVRSENPGVAFGMFSESTSRFRTGALIGFSVLAIGILAWMLLRVDRMDRMTSTGLALVFGGALGNVFDRVRSGVVTDFLDFYFRDVHWYAFNVADSAICVGAALLLIAMWKTPGRSPNAT